MFSPRKRIFLLLELEDVMSNAGNYYWMISSSWYVINVLESSQWKLPVIDLLSFSLCSNVLISAIRISLVFTRRNTCYRVRIAHPSIFFDNSSARYATFRS